MNLLITLPVGVLIILGAFALLNWCFRLGLFPTAGILTAATILIYGIIVTVSWPGADVFAIHLAVYLMSIYAVTVITHSRTGKARWHWGPALIVGFFVFVIMVNSVFIFLAQSGLSPEWAKRLLPEPAGSESVQSHFPGTVSHDFREKGMQFNEYREQRLAQMKQGWQVRIGWQDPAVVGKQNTLVLEVLDADGLPIDNAAVSGKMIFPGDMRLDQAFSMTYEYKGHYLANLRMPVAGKWDAVILITREDQKHEIRAATLVGETHSQ